MSASDGSPFARGTDGGQGEERLTGSPAVRLHVALALGLAVSAGAFVIEVFRALGGNTLSWVYVVEWPMLAAFGTYMWWSLLTGRDRRRPLLRARGGAANAVPDDKLEAWTRYVRQLEAADRDGVDQPL